MKRRILILSLAFAILLVSPTLTACGGGGGGLSLPGGGANETLEEDPEAPDRDNTPVILENIAAGESFFDGEGAIVDYSNVQDGYVMIKYEGTNDKVKVQITRDGGETYTYDLVARDNYVAFPLSDGDGYYQVSVFLNIDGSQYSTACSGGFDVQLPDEFQPFLRANQFSNFDSSTQAVAKAQELLAGTKSDLGAIERVFIFIVENVEYDYDLAATVESGYIPNVDATLTSGKGICFDYAALMTAMLRSQGIPTILQVGYAGEAYHAWISVYIDEIGWVANIVQFDGEGWSRMDPTFAASGNSADPNLVGDGEKYNEMFHY